MVALADEATASDGDMITAAFKLLKLGPVVGQRTWGGVVGMTGRHQLGDGTVITVPMNAAWFDAYGWSVENRGVLPDLEILRTPLDWAEGRHAQLDDAVRLALDLLTTNPPATPPDYSDVPDRSRPKLPPRGRQPGNGRERGALQQGTPSVLRRTSGVEVLAHALLVLVRARRALGVLVTPAAALLSLLLGLLGLLLGLTLPLLGLVLELVLHTHVGSLLNEGFRAPWWGLDQIHTVRHSAHFDQLRCVALACSSASPPAPTSPDRIPSSRGAKRRISRCPTVPMRPGR